MQGQVGWVMYYTCLHLLLHFSDFPWVFLSPIRATLTLGQGRYANLQCRVQPPKTKTRGPVLGDWGWSLETVELMITPSVQEVANVEPKCTTLVERVEPICTTVIERVELGLNPPLNLGRCRSRLTSPRVKFPTDWDCRTNQREVMDSLW